MREEVTKFLCPYLKGEVELTSEREQHITENHPDLLPAYRSSFEEILADWMKCGAVYKSRAPSTRGFPYFVRSMTCFQRRGRPS
jgi:hypothetical protein